MSGFIASTTPARNTPSTVWRSFESQDTAQSASTIASGREESKSFTSASTPFPEAVVFSSVLRVVSSHAKFSSVFAVWTSVRSTSHVLTMLLSDASAP